jgi:hypothetical protein
MFKDLISIALFKKDLNEVAREATMGSGFFYYIVTLLIVVVASLVISFLSQISIGIGAGTALASVMTATITTMISIIVLMVFVIPLGIIVSLIYFAVVNIVAKMLGGKGDFAKTTAVLWTVGAAVAITYSLALQVLLGIFQVIFGFMGAMGVTIMGIVTLIVIPISLAITIISIYLESKAIAAVHNISTLKGFAALMIPLVILAIIVLAIALVLILILGAALFSMAGPIVSNPTGYFGLM